MYARDQRRLDAGTMAGPVSVSGQEVGDLGGGVSSWPPDPDDRGARGPGPVAVAEQMQPRFTDRSGAVDGDVPIGPGRPRGVRWDSAGRKPVHQMTASTAMRDPSAHDNPSRVSRSNIGVAAPITTTSTTPVTMSSSARVQAQQLGSRTAHRAATESRRTLWWTLMPRRSDSTMPAFRNWVR